MVTYTCYIVTLNNNIAPAFSCIFKLLEFSSSQKKKIRKYFIVYSGTAKNPVISSSANIEHIQCFAIMYLKY